MDFNIRYEIIGCIDGRWVVRAFNQNNEPIGIEIQVSSYKEARDHLYVLSGYSVLLDDEEPTLNLKMEKAS
jgi:hypothetical protein